MSGRAEAHSTLLYISSPEGIAVLRWEALPALRAVAFGGRPERDDAAGRTSTYGSRSTGVPRDSVTVAPVGEDLDHDVDLHEDLEPGRRGDLSRPAADSL